MLFTAYGLSVYLPHANHTHNRERGVSEWQQREKRSQCNPKGGLTLDDAFEQFIQSKTVMNVAEETIKHYRNVFRYFIEFYGTEQSCADVTEKTIIDYLVHIRETKPGLAIKTVNTYVKGLRAIFYFMMANDWIGEFKIKLPRVEETIKKTYSDFAAILEPLDFRPQK